MYSNDTIIATKGSTSIENMLKFLKHGREIDAGERDSKIKKFNFTSNANVKWFFSANAKKIEEANAHKSNLSCYLNNWIYEARL